MDNDHISEFGEIVAIDTRRSSLDRKQTSLGGSSCGGGCGGCSGGCSGGNGGSGGSGSSAPENSK